MPASEPNSEAGSIEAAQDLERACDVEATFSATLKNQPDVAAVVDANQ
jgi:hypothetical protein